jgi:hypothetical protein
MGDKIDISKINADFGENDKLKDEHLLSLLSRAYKGEITCRRANIKMEAIKPSIDYVPTISEDLRAHFLTKAKEGKPFPLFVYQKNGKFMMSDDYNSYTLYKELEFDVIPCVVVGDINDVKDIVNLGEPFHLEAPTFEVIN